MVGMEMDGIATAGQLTAGTQMGGLLTAGRLMAGTQMDGLLTAGQLMVGTQMDGLLPVGQPMAGMQTDGPPTVGHLMVGTQMDGKAIFRELAADGPETAGMCLLTIPEGPTQGMPLFLLWIGIMPDSCHIHCQILQARMVKALTVGMTGSNSA
ncbi:hypothetical protein [Neobacillus sp. YIM B06451]|uniref:hypothetical protein n=1 Tax=Neobacillus sp. YIM B06451 TaxID=3070994 RepID=UPI00292E2C47|nr:hypothetical protein [Neobacillus sp. YIM B06451]